VPHDFELRFPIADIPKYAGLYDYPGEAELIAGPVARARTRGRLTYEEFLAIGKWKSQRPGNAKPQPSRVCRRSHPYRSGARYIAAPSDCGLDAP